MDQLTGPADFSVKEMVGYKVKKKNTAQEYFYQNYLCTRPLPRTNTLSDPKKSSEKKFPVHESGHFKKFAPTPNNVFPSNGQPLNAIV